MAEQQEERWTLGKERDRDRERAEAFSDAVIAIVITLLSIELLQAAPEETDQPHLARTFFEQWPAYLAFIITFFIVGQIWLTHHNMWRYVEKVDQTLLVLNLVLLLFVTTIPFSATVLAKNLQGTPTEQRLSAALYLATIMGEAIFFNLSWWWARRRQLLHPGIDQSLIRAIARRYKVGPVLYLVAFSAVFVNAVLSLLLYLLLVVMYIIPGPGDLQIRSPEEDAGTT